MRVLNIAWSLFLTSAFAVPQAANATSFCIPQEARVSNESSYDSSRWVQKEFTVLSRNRFGCFRRIGDSNQLFTKYVVDYNNAGFVTAGIFGFEEDKFAEENEFLLTVILATRPSLISRQEAVLNMITRTRQISPDRAVTLAPGILLAVSDDEAILSISTK